MQNPDPLTCPITCARLVDPVMTVDGHTYERTAIEHWLSAHHTSPLTGQPLSSNRVVPNWLVRQVLRSGPEPGSEASSVVSGRASSGGTPFPKGRGPFPRGSGAREWIANLKDDLDTALSALLRQHPSPAMTGAMGPARADASTADSRLPASGDRAPIPPTSVASADDDSSEDEAAAAGPRARAGTASAHNSGAQLLGDRRRAGDGMGSRDDAGWHAVGGVRARGPAVLLSDYDSDTLPSGDRYRGSDGMGSREDAEWQPPQRRRRRGGDISQTDRQVAAFRQFKREFVAEHEAAHPTMSRTEIGRRAVERWRRMDVEDRRYYGSGSRSPRRTRSLGQVDATLAR